jgi:hypothetical protein
VGSVVRPIHTVSDTPLHPSWVSGFTEGEGCFSLSISKRNQVLAIFQIELHDREKHLIRKIVEFFGDLCNINFPLSGEASRIVRFSITRQKHLIDVIIPHFDTY